MRIAYGRCAACSGSFQLDCAINGLSRSLAGQATHSNLALAIMSSTFLDASAPTVCVRRQRLRETSDSDEIPAGTTDHVSTQWVARRQLPRGRRQFPPAAPSPRPAHEHDRRLHRSTLVIADTLDGAEIARLPVAICRRRPLLEDRTPLSIAMATDQHRHRNGRSPRLGRAGSDGGVAGGGGG